mmetsp:Transcript_35132/g.100898  ORF Transcript_35132/g.100898 Transcript_35132/m.100898 type:complete len:207 (-) Transcript_35132:466-1086(-)
MRQDRVHKVQFAAAFEGNPILLWPVIHSASQGVAGCDPLRMADVDAGCKVHLRHGLALLAAVTAQGGIGAEGQLDGPGVPVRELEDLRVLGARDYEARQRLVRLVVDLAGAEARPRPLVVRGAQPRPALQLGQRRDGAHVDPPVPLGPPHELRADHDLGVPDLLYARHLLAVVEAVVPPPMRSAVPPRNEDDFVLTSEEERGVDQN